MTAANDEGAVQAIRWTGTALELLDQRRLPDAVEYLTITTLEQAANAITDMVVRGAPAIGITAAYGAVLGARSLAVHDDWATRLRPGLAGP